MPSHYWGDEWFEKHGDHLNEAIHYCMDFWLKWGRIGSLGKEKYGTFRDHPAFWDGGLWGLFWPGYCWIGKGVASFLYYKVDPYFTKPLTRYSGLLRLGRWWQRQVYNYAVQQACKKYPDIIDELVADLDGHEFVTPGLFGPIDGVKIHNKYWRRVE